MDKLVGLLKEIMKAIILLVGGVALISVSALSKEYLPGYVQLIILFILIFILLFYSFFKKINNYKDLEKRVSSYGMIGMRRKAINTLLWGREHLIFSELQQASVDLKLGSLYLTEKEYKKAAEYFSQAYELAFKFPKVYVGSASVKEAVDALVLTDQRDIAISIYQKLIENGSIKRNKRIEKTLNQKN